ncbi:MAG: hypothetical protein AAGI52_11540 [Bacteroidota bacterium]
MLARPLVRAILLAVLPTNSAVAQHAGADALEELGLPPDLVAVAQGDERAASALLGLPDSTFRVGEGLLYEGTAATWAAAGGTVYAMLCEPDAPYDFRAGCGESRAPYRRVRELWWERPFEDAGAADAFRAQLARVLRSHALSSFVECDHEHWELGGVIAEVGRGSSRATVTLSLSPTPDPLPE